MAPEFWILLSLPLTRGFLKLVEMTGMHPAAVEIPELTEQEISDKPDGMATLTACTWSER
ncbi:hypothetical protein [uncultured Nostoc sp.]|uniref:hypothetical protein n=1 Tax=uncultured Nostoc sp. TaxID=340711 RepID=UPI0035CAD487